MLNKMHKNYDINKKYGIRKFTVGVFSVALGLIIVPEVGNIDFNGNIVKHEAKAAETTNVQLSYVEHGSKVATLDGRGNLVFELDPFIKNIERAMSKSLNFANRNSVEERRIFGNPNSPEIAYGLALDDNDDGIVKKDKVIIAKSNKNKIKYRLLPVNTYSLNDVEPGKYQIKQTYMINRATDEVFKFLSSLDKTNEDTKKDSFPKYHTADSELDAKIKMYIFALEGLRNKEYANHGISTEEDIQRVVSILKEASRTVKEYRIESNVSEVPNNEFDDFMSHLGEEIGMLDERNWSQDETTMTSDLIYGKNTTYSVIRKEDNKEIGTFEINNKGISNTLTLPDGEYKIVETDGGNHALSTFAEDIDFTVITVQHSRDQVIYQATYNGKDIGNKVIVEQDGERVGKQYTVSLEEQEDKDTGLVYRPKQSSYTGTVKATNGITRVEYEPVMVNGPITFKPPFKSQVPIELFSEGSVQKGTVSKVTLTDITDENGTVWTPNITKPRAGKIDEITYSIKEVRGKSLEQEQLEQGWQKAQRTDKVEIDYGNYLLIGSFSAPRFDGTIGSPAIYMFDKRVNKDITHVFAGRYNWSVWDNAQIVRGANKSLFRYDLNKASFYKKDNAVKAIVETADGRIETILSKGSHGGILVETKYTNKQGKTVNFGYSRYIDTYLDNNDRVSVFSLGNNNGVYMETDKYRLDYFMKVPDAPDNFDSRFYNKLNGIETNGRKDTPDMMTPNTLLLSKTVDSGIQLGWKDKPLANGETRTMGVEVKLSFASKISSEFSRNRENWDTNTTSRELYPNLPINYDLTGTINPELLGKFTKATVSITIPEGISLVNNSVSILNGDNSVKTTLQGTYNQNTRTFTVEVPKEQTKNNNFKIRLNIKATPNTSKSYTFTERIDVDNDINAGEKTNTAILNVVQNNRNIAVKYVDEKGNVLKDSVISSQQRGTTYNVSSVSKPTTLSFNDASYSYLRTEGNLTGTLTDNAVISHVYSPTKGANITVKYLAGTTEVVVPLVLEGNLNSKIPTVNKPDVIRKNGKLYKLSTNNTDFSNTRFTNNIQSFTVNYDELATANYVYKKVVNRNGVLETLGESTVIYREGDKVGTSYNLTAPETFSLNGKKYKIKNIADKNISGQVKGTEATPVKNIEYNEVISSPINYQPVFRNSPLGTPKVIANTDTVVGGNYNVVPEEIIVNGIKYVPKNNRALTGVIDSGKTINVEYEEKQGNSRISYQPKFNGNNLGSPIPVENQITNRREGATFEVSPNSELTVDNKVYKLRNATDKVRGTITQSPQTKEIEYVAKNSTNATTYQPKLNGNNLGNTIEITPITQVGTSYNVVPKDITVDGKVYEPISKNALTGRVAENNTPVSVNYQPKLSVNALNYQPKVNGQPMGNPIEIVSRNSQIGTPYNVVPKDITVNGKVYEAISKTPLTGRTTPTNTPIEVEYRAKQGNGEISYQPKLNGSNLGTPISVKDQITDKQEGASFVVSPNNEITVDNKVYKLKTPTDKVKGTITQSPQTKEIEYVAKNSNNNLAYQPKFNGNNLGNNIEITPITQIGTPYSVVPKDITVDGKVYKPVSTNSLTGRVSENNTPLEVNYQPKLSANALNYQPKVNGQPIGTPIEVVPSNSQVGTPYNVVPKDIVVNGKVYEPVSKSALTGRTTERNTPLDVEYREKQGNNEISYQPKLNGNNLGTPISVRDQITNRQEGANFEVSPNNEITVDNKVYKLKTPTDKVRGIITQSPQTKEIEYVAKNSNNNLVYQPKLNGNNLGSTIEITPITQIGTSYNVVPKDITIDNKVYEPVSKDALTGRVAENNTPLEVNYQPKLSNTALNYQPKVNGNPIGNPVEVVPSNSQIGTLYNVVPKEITVDGKVYEPVSKDALTGRTTENNTPIEVEYRAKQGNTEISYQPKFNGNDLGTPVSVKDQITDKQEGANFEVSPNNEITIDNKVYKLKTPTDKVSGKITQSPQTKEIEYVAKDSNNNLTYQPKLNGSNLGDNIEITPITQIGTPYNVIPKEITIDGKVYEPVSKDALTGRVSENNTPLEVNYQPKLSSNALNYQPKLNGTPIGNPIEVVPSNSQVGTPYDVTPKDIIVNGKVYEPVVKDNLTGRTTDANTPIEVEYRAKQGNSEISYQPKFDGNNLGEPVSVKDQITDKQEGANFEVSPNSEITVDNKVYKLKTPTDKVNGTITQSPQTKEIEYVEKNSSNGTSYQPKFNNANLGTPIEITPITQVGTSYNVVPKDITVDDKVYEPVSKDALTGRVAENNTPVEVNYQPKLSANALNYQPKVNGQPIGNPIEVVPSNSQIGTPYNVVTKDITVNGKVYEPVSKDALTGRTTETNTPLEVEYRAKQGNSEISYQPKFNGNDLGTPVSVKDQITDKQEGANFEITPNSEITVDNKVYKLKIPTDKVSGTITQSPQTKEIEYVAKDSNNNLVYQPKLNGNTLGDTIEITPITQIGTPYEITPKDITVDGKVYEPVSKNALTGRVAENNTPLEVNYQPKLSNNALNYQLKVNGQPIGNPIEVVPSNSQVGTPYNVIPKDITVNGRVYEPVSKDTLTGRTTETNTPLEVEYRAKQGNSEISYQPKFNGNDLGTPVSVKDQITDKQEGATFEVLPNNEITIDDKVYKLKTPTDKVSGIITQSPQTKEIEYVAKDSNNNLVYQPKLSGNDLGTSIEITPVAQIGTPYNVIPKEITVDGKVYEPVSKDALTGRVSENNTPLEVNYQPKLSSNALNYQPKVNGQPIGNPIEIVPSNSQVGTPYEITPKEITIDGKVYEPVVKDNLTGRTTEANTPIEVEYRAKQGNSEISYQPKLNEDNLGTPISVKDQITDKQEGANFEVSPNNEITVDNKVYKLKTPTDKVNGTITQSPQVKEVEYIAKNSNNNLGYQPKFNESNLGDSVEIIPIAQIGTPYNVIPKEITIDGKVYEPVSKDALTGRVSENNTPIEVNYQPKLNSKALEYQPKVNGKELRKPIEILPSNSQIGTPYNVVPKKLLIDGKLYIPVNKDTLTGKLLEKNETINVEYKESKDYNDTFKQFKEIEKDVVYVSADKDKKVAYDKELENLSNLLKGEKNPSDIEKSVANLEKLKEALNGKANLLKAIEKAKEEISKLTYIIPQSDPILDMLDEPSIIDVEEITHIVEDAKELNNTVKEIVKVLDKHNEKDIDYKKATPEKKEEYNKKAKEILEALKDKTLNKEKALEKAKELNKVSENLDGIENKQKQDAIISEIEKNTNLPKEVKEKLIKEIENTTSSEDLNKLLDKGKFIDKEIKENKNVLSKQVNVSNLSDKEKEEYNKALKDYENALSNPNSTKEDIEKAKAVLLKFIKEKNEVQFSKGTIAILEKEEAFILEYKDENNKVIKTAIFSTSKKENTDLLYPKELISDNGEKYIRNSDNTYSLVKDNNKSLENKKEKSVVDEDNNNVKPITDKKDVVSTNDKEVKSDNKEATIKKEELPKTSSSMLSTLGLFSIFGLRKNRKKDK